MPRHMVRTFIQRRLTDLLRTPHVRTVAPRGKLPCASGNVQHAGGRYAALVRRRRHVRVSSVSRRSSSCGGSTEMAATGACRSHGVVATAGATARRPCTCFPSCPSCRAAAPGSSTLRRSTEDNSAARMLFFCWSPRSVSDFGVITWKSADVHCRKGAAAARRRRRRHDGAAAVSAAAVCQRRRRLSALPAVSQRCRGADAVSVR
eukprot:scaffold72633_cov48-Phaeocystis_antarctica.AAC.1